MRSTALGLLVLLWAGCNGSDGTDGDKDVADTDDTGTTDTDTDTPLPTDIDADQDGFPNDEDCDDDDPLSYPGAEELCDGRDNACDGAPEPTQLATLGEVNYGTIAEALAEAEDGDVVGVCPGTYVENLLIDGDITLVGYELPAIDGGAAGAVIDIASGEITIEGFELYNGSGSVYGPLVSNGGAINGNDATGPLTVVDCDIHDSLAELGGGVLFGEQGGSLVGSTVYGNTAGAFAGGVYTEGPVTIDASTIEDNSAAENGGGIAVGAAQALVLTGTTVQTNTSLLGGGVFVFQEGSVDADAATAVTGNTATAAGGGVYLWSADWTGGSIDTNEVLVADPAATGFGGGGSVFEGGSLSDVSVTGNTADIGAGLDLRGVVDLVDVSVDANVAAEDGGGAYVLDATVTADASTVLSANSAVERGGGVYLADSTWIGGELDGNDADLGGGFNLAGVSGTNNASIEDAVVRGNSATTSGGGVYATSDFTLDAVTITQNLSDDRGAGLYATLDAVGVVSDTSIDANNAVNRGGGVYLNSGAVTTLTSTPIERNQADRGAGVYINGGSAMTMLDGTVGANGDVTTISGGGARVQDGTLTVTNGDWSEGLTENSPDDVYVGVGLAAYVGYGAGVSFSCDANACTPEP